jgi:hypothetical protein
MELTVLGQTFDRRHFGAIGLNRQHGARLDALTIEQDNAGAALAGVASDMRTRQVQLFTEIVNQQCTRLDIALVLFAIDYD